MKKISSGSTSFYKRIFPKLWFGFLGIFLIISLTANDVSIPTIGLVLGMATFGYILMKYTVLNVVDEVYDLGNSLIIRNNNLEIKLPLTAISKVRYIRSRPPKVNLKLNRKTKFGDDISFCAPVTFMSLRKSEAIQDLINRIAEQNQS